MTLWWIADALLVLVVLPVVIYLLYGVLTAARSITPQRRRDHPRSRPRHRRIWTPYRCS